MRLYALRETKPKVLTRIVRETFRCETSPGAGRHQRKEDPNGKVLSDNSRSCLKDPVNNTGDKIGVAGSVSPTWLKCSHLLQRGVDTPPLEYGVYVPFFRSRVGF